MNRDQEKAIFASIYSKTGKRFTSSSLKAYDVKARKKVSIEDPRLTKFKNGRYAVRGKSSATGINVFRII